MTAEFNDDSVRRDRTKTKETMKSWTELAVCLDLAAVVPVPVPSEAAAPPPRVYETTESGRTHQPIAGADRVKHQDQPAEASPQAGGSKTEKPKGKQPDLPGQEEKNR